MVLIRILILSLVIVSAPEFTNSVVPLASGLEIRSCIADLCIVPNYLPLKNVILEYGGRRNARKLCYSIRENGLCLVVTAFDHPKHMSEFVESLEIGKGCNCTVVTDPQKAFPTVLTSDGLGIGDTFIAVANFRASVSPDIMRSSRLTPATI